MEGNKRWQIMIILMAGLILSLLSLAAGMKEGKVVIGGEYVLRSGETLAGDLVMIGGHAILEENGLVQRNLALIGSSLESSGTVQGDIVGIGSRIDLTSSAIVKGRVMLLNATLQSEAGAQVGEVVHLKPFSNINPSPFYQSRFNWLSMGIGRWFAFLFKVFAWSALAVLIGLLFPHALERIADAVSAETAIAIGLGFLTWIISITVVLFLIITLIFIPLAFVAAIIVSAGWFMGIIGVGAVGKKDHSPASSRLVFTDHCGSRDFYPGVYYKRNLGFDPLHWMDCPLFVWFVRIWGSGDDPFWNGNPC